MKKTFIFSGLSFISFLLLSALASAQGGSVSGGVTTLAGVVTTINTTIVKALGTLFMSMAVIAFFWGIVQYIWGIREGKLDKIAAGNQFMVWGLIGLFVMFSVYGIINYAGSIFGIQPGGTITIPDIQIRGGGSNGGAGGGGTGGTSPLAPNRGYCPDGVTQFDLSAGVQSCPQTVYYCPDGITPYYNLSDRRNCPASSGVPAGTGGSGNPCGEYGCNTPG